MLACQLQADDWLKTLSDEHKSRRRGKERSGKEHTERTVSSIQCIVTQKSFSLKWTELISCRVGTGLQAKITMISLWFHSISIEPKYTSLGKRLSCWKPVCHHSCLENASVAPGMKGWRCCMLEEITRKTAVLFCSLSYKDVDVFIYLVVDLICILHHMAAKATLGGFHSILLVHIIKQSSGGSCHCPSGIQMCWLSSHSLGKFLSCP